MAGGLVIKRKRQDIIAEKAGVFGAAQTAIKPLGRLKELLDSPLAAFPNYQADTTACVPCMASFLNRWNSYKETGQDSKLAWRFPYALVRHFPGGTIPQETLDVLRKLGQCTDRLLPQAAVAGGGLDFLAQNPDSITAEMRAEAKGYKIGPYLFLEDSGLPNVYRYLVQSPVMIGVYINPAKWETQAIVEPQTQGTGHAVLAWDVFEDNDGNKSLACISWDDKNALDIKYLSLEYPIQFAAVARDLPDGVDTKRIRRGTVFSQFFEKLYALAL